MDIWKLSKKIWSCKRGLTTYKVSIVDLYVYVISIDIKTKDDLHTSSSTSLSSTAWLIPLFNKYFDNSKLIDEV